MFKIIKNFNWIILSSILCIFMGIITFLTFINESFIPLNDKNLQTLLIIDILLLIVFFTLIFRNFYRFYYTGKKNKKGSQTNLKYISVFSLFTVIPSLIVAIFSLFIFNFGVQNYFDIQEESIGWITGAQVTYCAEAFPTVDFFHKDAPALSVLGAVLRNGYLHSAIREKGGAYGSGAMQDSNNKVFKFFSYRDPRCSETFEEFQKSREWSLKNITQEQLDEGVLGIISSIDKPLSPFGEAMSDFSMNLDKKDLEARLRIRSSVQSCSLDDLVNVSQKYLFNESKRSVIAGENYIDEMKKLNFKIQNI